MRRVETAKLDAATCLRQPQRDGQGGPNLREHGYGG